MIDPTPLDNVSTQATTFLAWTDPGLAKNSDAELAETAVLQCLALVQAYVLDKPGEAPGTLWSQALSQLPLVSVAAQNTLSTTADQLDVLVAQVAKSLANLAGAASGDAIVPLLPMSPHQAGTEQNLVQTVVSASAGQVTAQISQLVLTFEEVDSGLLPPQREWKLSETLSSIAFAYQQLKVPATRDNWNKLMAGTKPSEVTSLPTYHRLTL